MNKYRNSGVVKLPDSSRQCIPGNPGYWPVMWVSIDDAYRPHRPHRPHHPRHLQPNTNTNPNPITLGDVVTGAWFTL